MTKHKLRGARFVFEHGAEIWIDDASGRCVLIPAPESSEPTRSCTVGQLYGALLVEAYDRGLIGGEELAHAEL